MIGIENKDSSFFTVESPDVDLDESDFSKDLISMAITERMDGMPQGTLKFNDPHHFISDILRTGAKLTLSWGYRTRDMAPDSLLTKKLNLDEVTGQLVRRGLEGFVTAPSGGGASNGVVTYNCNFTSYGFRGEDRSKLFTEGTKADVIAQVMDRIGVDPKRRFIDFADGNDVLNTERGVRQDETDYRFLTKKAREWHSLFSIGYAQDGASVAIFIDPWKIGDIPFSKWKTGATGFSHIIGYKGELSNIISYTWKSNESESGIGDNVKMEIVDGQPIFRRFIAKQKEIITYRLNPEKIKEALQDQAAGGLGAQTKLVKELLSTKTFDQIKRFFDPIRSTTAPFGYGYRINVEMIGNPLFSPPNQIVFNNGIPDRILTSEIEPEKRRGLGAGKSQIQNKFYLDEVTHNIGRSGYLMSTKIIDAFALSDIGLALL